MAPQRRIRLLGRKRGMTQVFDANGISQAATVIECEPNEITQVKTKENDGYTAIQLGFETIVCKDARTLEKRATKAVRGHFQKANIEPKRFLKEAHLNTVDGYVVGQKLGVELFKDVAFVDVCGVSKGKGYAGVIKAHHFSGGRATHGSSFHRHGGSTGMRSDPGIVLKGKKMAKHLGAVRVTTQNIRVIKVLPEKNLILVQGSVPGPTNAFVTLSPAVKRLHAKPKKPIKQPAGKKGAK